ncbi:MAG: carboxypeptidase-like regulatory domain-containing protein [Planctomycetota bacterium]
MSRARSRWPVGALALAALALAVVAFTLTVPRERGVAESVRNDRRGDVAAPRHDGLLDPSRPTGRTASTVHDSIDALALTFGASPGVETLRVVDRETRAPIAGVGVFFHRRIGVYGSRDRQPVELAALLPYPDVLAEPQAVTGPEGCFPLPGRAQDVHFATLVAEGWSCRIIALRSHVDAEEIELTRSGTIHGHVSGAPAGSRIVVRIDPGRLLDPTWRWPGGPIDLKLALPPHGAFDCRSIPAFAEFQVSLVDGDGETLLAEPESMRLAPGESREIAWGSAHGCRIAGRVRANDAGPCDDIEVGLLAPDDWWGPLPNQFIFSPTQVATTDANGAFAFEGVTPGEWCVSVAPHVAEAMEDGPFVPLPARVLVDANALELTVEIGVARASTIEGVVVAPDGTPADARVAATDVNGRPLAEERTAWKGRFHIEGIPPGPVRLTATPMSRGKKSRFLAPSKEIEVAAGTNDAQLVLGRGAAVTAVAYDELARERVRAHFELNHAEEDVFKTTRGRSTPPLSFTADMLPAGRASLTAYTDDGRAGIIDSIALVPGSHDAEVKIPLVPCGYLELENRVSEATLHVELIRGGTVVRSLWPPFASSLRVALPPGGYTVRIHRVSLRGGLMRREIGGERQVTILEGRETAVRVP